MSVFIFTGCETIIDCITGINPKLVPKDLAYGHLNQRYSEDVVFEMDNASAGNYYIDGADIAGDLPPGISCSISGSDTIHFQGKPTKAGACRFKVKISVNSNLNNSDGSADMCNSVASKEYMIIMISD